MNRNCMTNFDGLLDNLSGIFFSIRPQDPESLLISHEQPLTLINVSLMP